MSPFRLSSRTLPPRRAGALRSVRSVSARSGPVRPGAARAGTARSAPGGSVPGGSLPAGSKPAGLVPGPVPVPWRVVRRGLGVIELEHRGSETAHSVRFALSGAGLLGLSLPRTVQPGERLRVAVRGAQAESTVAARDAMLVLRWFEPDGTELLWPIAVD